MARTKQTARQQPEPTAAAAPAPAPAAAAKKASAKKAHPNTGRKKVPDYNSLENYAIVLAGEAARRAPDQEGNGMKEKLLKLYPVKLEEVSKAHPDLWPEVMWKGDDEHEAQLWTSLVENGL